MRSYFLALISGQRCGPLAVLLRGLLRALSLGYILAHATRHRLYRSGLLPSHKFPRPVISIGNLTAGGTGKTPLVEFIARWFARKNHRVAVLARGYGRIDASGRDDEDLLSSMGLENVVRLAGSDRVATGKRALAEYKADLLLLDDGFQHYRVQRTLDLVVLDATQPFSNGCRLPRGLLRESPRALGRADLILLSRTDQVSPEALEELRRRVGPAVETVHRPVHLRQLGSRKHLELDWLRARPVVAFCGLGNPEAFRKTLESLGARIVQFRVFDDHHAYTEQDLRGIAAGAEEFMAQGVVTTEKDATKVSADRFELPLVSLRVEIEITRNAELLEERLQAVLRDLPQTAAPLER